MEPQGPLWVPMLGARMSIDLVIPPPGAMITVVSDDSTWESGRFNAPGFTQANSNIDRRQWPITRSGSLQNLFVYSANSRTGEHTMTVFKNEVATSLSVTFSGLGNNVPAQAQNTEDKVPVEAGDLLSVRYTRVGGSNIRDATAVSFEIL